MKKTLTAGLNMVSRIFVLLALASQTTKAMEVNSISVNDDLITVHFDTPVQALSATNIDNYTIVSKSLSTTVARITNAVLETNDFETVALYLNGSAGEFFAVGVSNVVDMSDNTNDAALTGYTGYFNTTNIGTADDPFPAGLAIPVSSSQYLIEANGSDIGGTNDHCLYLYEQITSNFDISVQVPMLQETTFEAKAGLYAREDLTTGGRSVGVFVNPPFALSSTNFVETLTRSSTNGTAGSFSSTTASTSAVSLNWLRLTRNNNLFTAYASTNGFDWVTIGSTNQAFSKTLSIGLAVTSQTNGEQTTAEFDNLGISGTRLGDDLIPTTHVSVYQATNLVVGWQYPAHDPSIPVHDYAVQVATSLTPVSSNGLSVSNATQWAFLMLPIFETDVTGTNAAMPSAGTYMTIPMNLFSNQTAYLRLAQVDRLIPDPLSCTPGIVLGQGSGNFASQSASSICSVNVTASTCVAPSQYILCPGTATGKYSYTFTTQPSSAGYNYIVETKQIPLINNTSCGINDASTSGKAYTTVTPTSATQEYTFVAGATTVLPTNCYTRVQVNIITNF